MRTYGLSLLVLLALSAAASAEEKKSEKKDGNPTDELELDLDLPPAPIPAALDPNLDLDLDAADLAPTALAPPPAPEPPVKPVVTVRRVEPPPADPMPAPAAVLPPKEEAKKEAPPKFALSAGVLGSVGGMSASTPHGLSVSDTGSGVLGALAVGEWARWEARLALHHVFQDRWLAANVRSDGAWEGSLHAGRWLWSPMQDVLVGVLVGAAYRAHGAPDGAWWAARGPSPAEWRAEVVPSAVWRFSDRFDLAASVPFGYGSGSVDRRDWRNFNGAFMGVELAVRYVLSS